MLKLKMKLALLLSLRSLAPSYNYLITKLTYDKETRFGYCLLTSLLEELNRNSNNRENQVEGLFERRYKYKQEPNYQSRSRSKSKIAMNVMCYYCKKQGSIMKEYWKLKAKGTKCRRLRLQALQIS